MNVLGIETSCDETAAAVVQNGTKLLSNVVASQTEIHAQYGGVVPEVAARSHIEVMLPVVEQALAEAGVDWSGIDSIAVTHGPGLVGSLLIGTLTAETLAELKNKPLYPINHVQSHVYANFLIDTQPKFPLLALIVSGGHTQLVLFKDHGNYRLLGQTLDDAAGEAFDKVAKMLGLAYPGGPSIAAAALKGDDLAYPLPKPKLEGLNFSFSGLKTAVLRTAQQTAGKDYKLSSSELPKLLTEKQKHDLAASFQKTVVDILVNRTLEAYSQHQPTSVVIAGGVAANRLLRDELKKQLPAEISYAPINLCTDNAAMVASLGYFQAQIHQPVDYPDIKVAVNPVLSM